MRTLGTVGHTQTPPLGRLYQGPGDPLSLKLGQGKLRGRVSRDLGQLPPGPRERRRLSPVFGTSRYQAR